jgi:hypothetical protein
MSLLQMPVAVCRPLFFSKKAFSFRPLMGPPATLPMNYDETLHVRKRDVRPRKLTLEEEQVLS